MKRSLMIFLAGLWGISLWSQAFDNPARNRTVVSTTYTGGITEIAKVIDGLMDTRVLFSSGNYNASFVLRFPFKYSFTAAKLYFYYGNTPYDIRIEGSTDGITYQTLATYVIKSGEGYPTFFNLSSNSNLQYIRVSFNVTGNNNRNFELQEFELTGTTSARYDIGYDNSGNRISTKLIVLASSREKVRPIDSLSTGIPPLVDNDLGEEQIELFPNPTRGYVTLRCASSNPSVAIQYYLYDGNGRLLQGPVLLQGKAQIDLSRQAKGIYFIRLHAGERISDWKIIKQ